MRQLIIAGNWKMNKNISESIELANSLKRSLADIVEIEIVLCPPFTSLSDVKEVVMDTNIRLGAQDVYWESQGAFTGEVSATMLKNVGCAYCIVGHSERRQFFGETNQTVNKKAKALLREGIKPIVCVGEKLEERKANKTFDVIKDHVENSLAGLTEDEMLKVVIAYEPVWAIGTGNACEPEEALKSNLFIKKVIAEAYSPAVSEKIQLLYGGSVNSINCSAYIKEASFNGLLVGGASLKAEEFVDLVKNSSKG